MEQSRSFKYAAIRQDTETSERVVPFGNEQNARKQQ